MSLPPSVLDGMPNAPKAFNPCRQATLRIAAVGVAIMTPTTIGVVTESPKAPLSQIGWPSRTRTKKPH